MIYFLKPVVPFFRLKTRFSLSSRDFEARKIVSRINFAIKILLPGTNFSHFNRKLTQRDGLYPDAKGFIQLIPFKFNLGKALVELILKQTSN